MKILTDRTRRTAQDRLTSMRGKVSLATVFAALIVLTLAGCGGDSDIQYAKGRSIEIHATNPVTANKLTYADGQGEHWVVRPSASNRQLALVNVTIVNRTSTVMPLLVDPDAARLGDRRGERIRAVDPFVSSAASGGTDVDEDKFTPFLWGVISLERQMQVQGWVIFDVPKGLTLGSMFWDEVDEVVVDFIDYYRG